MQHLSYCDESLMKSYIQYTHHEICVQNQAYNQSTQDNSCPHRTDFAHIGLNFADVGLKGQGHEIIIK